MSLSIFAKLICLRKSVVKKTKEHRDKNGQVIHLKLDS